MKRFFILLSVSLILVIIQSMPWHYLFPCAIKFNLSLVFLVFLALYLPFSSGLAIAFILGYTLDAFSATPMGLLSLINLIALFFIDALRRILLFETLLSQVVLVFALSLSIDLFLLIFTRILFVCPLYLILKNLLVNSLVLMALSLPLFFIFNKWGFFKD